LNLRNVYSQKVQYFQFKILNLLQLLLLLIFFAFFKIWLYVLIHILIGISKKEVIYFILGYYYILLIHIPL